MSNVKISMSNQIQNPNVQRNYDLAERTAKFGEDVIEFVRGLPDNPINRPLIGQIVRSGTSIGANYMEADGATSKKDFHHKIGICRKESKETKHWLRMIDKANPDKKEKSQRLSKEAYEFSPIFSAILRSKKE